MKRLSPALLALLALAPACSHEPTSGDDTIASVANQCTSDADCGDGTCEAGACRALVGEIDRVVLEVVPDSTATFGAGLGFLLEADEVSAGDTRRDLALPALTSLRGRVRLTTPGTSCAYATAADGSIAARIDLAATDALLGIPRSSYAATSTSSAPKPGAPEGWSFAATVIPGVYDVYVTPADDPACPVAPVLLTSVPIAPGDLALPIDLGEPKELSGTIVPPLGATLEGWTLDVIDPVRGRPLSTSARLSASVPTNFRVQWRPAQATKADTGSLGVAGPASAIAAPLVRIVPPKDLAAPVALWDLSAADLDGDGSVSLDVSALSLGAVHVSGRLLGGGDAASPASGVVGLVSTSLAGAASGITATHGVTVSTDASGAFEADLLPGTYKLTALPDAASPWGLAQTSWTVEALPKGAAGAARVVALPARVELRGTAHAPDGRPIASTTVSAVPSTGASPNAVLDQALGKTSLLPRSASDYTAADGTFRLALDPGRFDVALAVPAGSGFPWAVAPQVDVPGAGGPIALDASWPLPLGGHLVDPSGEPVRRALVRAWAVLASDATGARTTAALADATRSAVQVGETHTDDAGRWRVLLPSRIGR